ncbi:hypothetical protein OHB93_02190 [Microbacterium sp. No. 7]|uniref:hypothetical protein n=1 Tax=Microbacterium sp. No. 7 TaxID=1714373 RepID=UPI00300B23B1
MVALDPRTVSFDLAVLAEARDLAAAGFQLVAVGRNKVPAHSKGFMELSPEEVTATAIDLVEAGRAHGIRLELGARGRRVDRVPFALEFEGRTCDNPEWDRRWAEQLDRLGAEQLWDRLRAGVVHRTPSGGKRWFFELVESGEDELPVRARTLWLDSDGKSQVMAELLTENAIVAPSGGQTHPTGKPYEAIMGRLQVDLPVLTLEEIQHLAIVLESVSDEGTASTEAPLHNVTDQVAAARLDFNRRGGSARRTLDLVTANGWAVIKGALPAEVSLTRPGTKSGDLHAQVGGPRRARGQMTVFTTSDDRLPSGRHDAFTVEAILRFGGDADAAAQKLSAVSASRAVVRAAHRPHVDVGMNADSMEAVQSIVDAARDARSRHDGSMPIVLRQVSAQDDFAALVLPQPGMAPRRLDRRDASFALLQVVQPVSGWKKEVDDAGRERLLPLNAHAVPTGIRDNVYNTLETDEAMPSVHLIATEPVLLASGKIIATPGFHADDRVLLSMRAGAHKVWALGYHVPTAPSLAEAQSALDLLMQEVFSDFPFADDGDRAVAVASLLTSCAPHLATKRPAFSVVAPDRGTGKSLLNEVIRTIAVGSTYGAEYSPFKSNDEENTKVLAAALLRGARFVGVDNVPTGAVVTSTLLTRLLTKEDGAEALRILGSNDTVPVTGLVHQFTGNSFSFGADIPRRVLSCELEVNGGLAFEREGFRHPDLLRWAQTNRPSLLAAVHTILLHGLNHPIEHAEVPFKMASFEQWTTVFAGAMSHLTIRAQNAGQLLNLGRKDFTDDNNEDGEEWGELLEWLAGLVGSTGPLTSGQIIERLQPPINRDNTTRFVRPKIALPDKLDEVLSSNSNTRPRRVASVLSSKARIKVLWGDRIFRLIEHRPAAGTASKKSRMWTVEVVSRTGETLAMPTPPADTQAAHTGELNPQHDGRHDTDFDELAAHAEAWVDEMAIARAEDRD